MENKSLSGFRLGEEDFPRVDEFSNEENNNIQSVMSYNSDHIFIDKLNHFSYKFIDLHVVSKSKNKKFSTQNIYSHSEDNALIKNINFDSFV